MNELQSRKNLKQKLDKIDKRVHGEVFEGFCGSRLRILIGMWEKGEAIAEYRGVNSASFYELEIKTGRQRESLKKWHDLYKKCPDKEKYTRIAEKQAEEWTEKALKLNWEAVLLSGSKEWYTPKEYIDSVYEVLSEIDLDPASCKEANQTIKAQKFYTKEDDGLSKPWMGKVFLNPPYGNDGPPFVEKLIQEYKTENITEFILLVNSRATDAEWFQPLYDGFICFTDHRIDFDSPEEKNTSSTHGSCFVYFGHNEKKFAESFSKHGSILKRFNG